MPTHEAAAAVHEALEERAAVRQYDGGMTRAAAETEAAGDLGIRALCLHCAHRSIRRTCLEPVRAGLASSFELVFTELLPDADCPAFAPKVAAA